VTETLQLPGSSVVKTMRRSLVSAAVGVAIVFLSTFGVDAPLRIRLLAYGALGGFFIAVTCSALGRLYLRWIPPTETRREKLYLAFVYFVGGGIGFALATIVAYVASLVPAGILGQVLPYSALISGGAAIVVGLLFYTFGRLQDRLRESVERLKEHEFAEKELELARSIQKRLLPPSEIETDGYRVSSRNVAARFVAGDFYDVFALGDGAIGIAVADVSGKGMGASLIMASVKAVLPLVAALRSVDDTLAELNRKLVAELGPREFVALAYLRCERDGRFTLGNAGLPDPYVIRSGCAPRALAVSGSRFPLGSRREVEYGSLEGRLEPGERLLLFTDGLPEAPTASGDPIGYPALERLLSADSISADVFVDRLFDRLRAATSPVLEDDWTAVAVERIS
jgi:MFS family permease